MNYFTSYKLMLIISIVYYMSTLPVSPVSAGVCKYVWILSGHDVLVLVSVSWPVAANEQVSGDDGEDQLAICTLPPPFIISQASPSHISSS